ncbi:hypothetical protein ES708_16245 [subsurface metagenome]
MSNLAFTTILIFIIVTPGIIARRSFLSSRFSIKYKSYKAIDEIVWSILPSLILHFMGYYFVLWWTPYKIDLITIGYLITGLESVKSIYQSFSAIDNYLFQIFLYYIVLCSVAVISGHLLRKFIKKIKFDTRFRSLRFSNMWEYYFTGEYMSFHDSIEEPFPFDFVFLNILVKMGDGSLYLYDGILSEYEMSKDGELDNIHLLYPARKKFEADNKDNAYYEIPSEFLILYYKDILNINVRFIKS